MDDQVEQNFSPDMKVEANRLKSFQQGWCVPYIKPEDCAAVGLFFLGEGDSVQCAFCNVILQKWKYGDKPIAEHVKHCPMCPYLLRQNVGNVPISGENGLQKWQIQNSKPERQHLTVKAKIPYINFRMKYPTMSSIDNRLRTFHNWNSDPTILHITPCDFAESGLFYSGVEDTLTCFSCGGQMGSWRPIDDPWTEHAKHFPFCSFVRIIKGKNFIEQSRSNYLSVIKEEPNVSSAIPNICKKLEEIQVKDNREDPFTCIICMESGTRIAFVPCGHCQTCTFCSKKLKKCPICRKSINSVMRLFL